MLSTIYKRLKLGFFSLQILTQVNGNMFLAN